MFDWRRQCKQCQRSSIGVVANSWWGTSNRLLAVWTEHLHADGRQTAEQIFNIFRRESLLCMYARRASKKYRTTVVEPTGSNVGDLRRPLLANLTFK